MCCEIVLSTRTHVSIKELVRLMSHDVHSCPFNSSCCCSFNYHHIAMIPIIQPVFWETNMLVAITSEALCVAKNWAYLARWLGDPIFFHGKSPCSLLKWLDDPNHPLNWVVVAPMFTTASSWYLANRATDRSVIFFFSDMSRIWGGKRVVCPPVPALLGFMRWNQSKNPQICWLWWLKYRKESSSPPECSISFPLNTSKNCSCLTPKDRQTRLLRQTSLLFFLQPSCVRIGYTPKWIFLKTNRVYHVPIKWHQMRKYSSWDATGYYDYYKVQNRDGPLSGSVKKFISPSLEISWELFPINFSQNHPKYHPKIHGFHKVELFPNHQLIEKPSKNPSIEFRLGALLRLKANLAVSIREIRQTGTLVEGSPLSTERVIELEAWLQYYKDPLKQVFMLGQTDVKHWYLLITSMFLIIYRHPPPFPLKYLS